MTVEYKHVKNERQPKIDKHVESSVQNIIKLIDAKISDATSDIMVTSVQLKITDPYSYYVGTKVEKHYRNYGYTATYSNDNIVIFL